DDAAAVVDGQRVLVARVQHDLAFVRDRPAAAVHALQVLLHQPRVVRARIQGVQVGLPGQRAGVGGHVQSAAAVGGAGEPVLPLAGGGLELLAAGRGDRLGDRQIALAAQVRDDDLVVHQRQRVQVGEEQLRLRVGGGDLVPVGGEVEDLFEHRQHPEIGRASCRERV